MNKKVIVGVAVLIIIIAGIIAYYFSTRPTPTGGKKVATVTMSTGETIEIPEGLTGNVMLYTSIPQEIMDGWVKDWNTYFANYSKLDYYRAGSGTVAAKVLAEYKAGNVQADVIYLAGYFDLKNLIQAGIIGKLPNIPELNSIPEEYKDPNGYYVMGRLLVMVIVYNPSLVSNPPKSWQDLLKPEWKGKIAIANPLVSGSWQYSVLSLVSKYGWDYFKQLKQNDPLVLQDVPDVARAVSTGERPVGVTLTMYLKTYTNLKYVIPEEGAIVIPSPIAIVNGTKHYADAVLLLRYLLSKQAAISLANAYTYSSRIDAPAPPGLPPLSQMKTFQATIKTIEPYVPGLRGNWTAIFGG
ncbi:MAG: extracellular solute-binding protein [Thermofilum sp.]|uniref:extracellular solute-binding protein n=1 Tax=Thermofilum sp. TaxID=1961369 RepID=UPI00258BE9BA|nr:extracellular solute-binding protein [Thermofilum sp.]MCI4409278.1 extracellular solute-binding protein [Thermofilum sp.]